MHSFQAHTSDVEIRLSAPSLAELFAEAGLALAEVTWGCPELPPAGASGEVVSLAAPDRDALLVDWLNELIYRGERDRRLFTKFAMEKVTERDLVARAYGAEVPELRTLVKAATFHRLRIEETTGGVAATVILDV